MSVSDNMRKKYGLTGNETQKLSKTQSGMHTAYDDWYDNNVDILYNQVYNKDKPNSAALEAAKNGYSFTGNTGPNPVTPPKRTASKDISPIGELEDYLIEQKKYNKESKQRDKSLARNLTPYPSETRDERDARVRQRYKDEQRIRELEDILAGNSRIEQPKSVNDVGSLEDSLMQNKKYGAPVEIAEQPEKIDLQRERAIEYTNAGNELYDLRQKIAKEDAQIEERNRYKKMEQYYDLLNNSDFRQKSAYTPTGGKADNSMAKIRGYQDYAFDFILYDAINGNRDAYEALRYVNSPAYQPEWADYNSEETQELTESEKKIFNYIYKTQGKKAATEYYNLLQPELQKRAAETELNKWRQEAREAPVGAAIASALMAPERALEYPLQLIDYAATGKINQYSPNARASRIRNAVTETITQDWGKVGSFAYQTGMSMVDFLINLGMGAAIGGGVGALGENATLLLMGSAAAADETIAKKQAGYDDKRAFILGAIAGAAETITERIGFDALFKTDIIKKGAKGFISYLLRNAASEGAEEGLSDIINWFADDMYDAFASQSESEWKRTIRALKEAHPDYSDSRLFGIALAQRAEELGLDIAGGVVSGIAMAGGMSAINAIGNDIGTRNTGKEIRAVGDDVVQSAIAEGLESKTDTQSYKLATTLNEKLQRGEQLTNKEIGQLYQANVEAINAENAETDAKKLQLPTIEERSTAQSAARNNQNLYLQEEAQRNILEARQAAQASENTSDAESNATLATQENATETRTTPESIAETKRLQLPTVKENNNVRGENDLRNGSERHNGENTSQQVRAVEESAGRNPRRQTLGYAKDVGISNLKTEGKAVSTYEMTGSGSKTDAHYLITGGETESLKRAREMSEAAGYKLVPYIGDNLHTLNPATNKESSDRAMIDLKNKVIYARADHPHFVIDQLVRHELGHDLVKQGKINVAQVVKQMQSIIKDRAAMKRSLDWLLSEYRQRYNSNDAFQNTGDAYADAYAGSGMTDEEIWEEIVCDSLGDMNAFAGDRTMSDSTRRIVDQYLAEIKNQAETQQTRAPPGELSQDVVDDIQHDRPIDTADEVKASREFDSKYQEKAEKKNKSLGFVAEDIMVKAGKQRSQVKEWLDAIADKLPPDVLGSTWIKDESYGGTEELTTVCIRSIGAHMLMDAIADKLGRPLNVIETTRISQAIFDYTDKPECLYCYVAMDRKAYREYLGSYIEQRDAFIKDIKDDKPAGIKIGKVDPDSAYGRFLGDRKNTSNMQDRARLWLNTYNSNGEFITAKDLANTENLMAAAERSSSAEKQVIDATAYAQSASWAKKQISYAAYNNHILRWSQKAIDKLNSHYGMRFYSFSDYSPAFLLENMQMVTDAAVRGLKGLGYTKEIDFAKAFAPTGMNINCSVFAYKDKATGEYLCDGMQGADWEEVKALRKKYPNVGAVLVATDDAQVEWALEQDWIDVIIPFHMVRTGSVVANYFGWKNYTAMSRDVANDKNAEVKSITPPMHQNNKELYLAKCKEYNLTPRFKQWVDHPNYMRLVNETRQSEGETSPMQPVFDLTGAKASIDAMVKQGGYAPPIGGSLENMLDIADEMAGKIKEGKPLGKLEEARASSVKYSRDFTPTAEDTEYLNAVNSGDMETAQKMVDEAAKKAGYKQYGDFYADSSLDLAVPKPTKQQLKTYELGQKYGNTESGYDKFYDEDFDAYEQIMLDDVANLKRWYLAGARGEMPSYRLAIRYGDVPSGKRSKNWATGELERGVSAVNFLTEKTQGEKTIYDAIYGMQGVDKNIIGGWDFGIYGSDGEPLLVDAENVVPFSDISKLKLADPVTYDDSGNVIPLSERFNEKNEDIRYSREFDADLFDVNEDIRKRIASPKASGNGLAWKGSPAAAKVDVDKLAEQIVSTYSSTLKAADIAKELASINDSIKALRKNMTVSEFEKLQDTTDELAKKILANALAKETGVKAELQDEPAGLNEYSYYQKKAISLITADILDSLLGGGQAVSAQNKKAAAKNIKLNNIRKAANEIMTSKQILADYVDQYGAIKKGEKASRDIQMPNKTGKDKKLSQTVRTILEAKATPDSIVPDIEYLAATGYFSYTRYSDKAAIQKAEETIKDKGWERALKDWLVDVNKNGEVSKTNTAIGWALYNAAANAGDVEAAVDILDALVKHQRNAAQAVQATRILKQLSPDAQLYGVARSVQNLQDDINEKYGEAKAPKLKIDEDLAQKFLEAKTQEERTKILQDIYRDIGRQMPTKFVDRWNAWRYLAMLGNPRTHVRNIVGNLGFTPVVMAKNLTATAIESAVDFVSGGRLNRTKGNIIGKRGSADILKAAWSDYDNVAEAALGGGKYSDFANANKYIEEDRRIFGKTKLKAWNKTGGRALEAYRKASGYALDKEDVWFSKPHYAIAFAQYAQANGITADQIRSGKGLEDARAYALQEAQKATYRDTNAFSQAVSRLGRGNKSSRNAFEKGLSTLAEGILPFRKTPANILARGVEYSPLGLLKSLSYDIVKVKQGKMTGAQMIDDVAAGLTGTGLLALGLLLASLGLVRGHGSDDDTEKAFADLMGHQAYSLELPGGKSITLDWLAPESLPFFIGVNLYEMTQGGKKDVTLATMLEAVGYATEPMLEMSCLKSLNDIFDAVGYAKEGDMNALTSTIVSAATSYLTQGLPTLLGQLERTIEGKRMTTYTEKNKFLTGDLQYTLGKASARVPGVDYEQIPYIDAWGREELTGTALSRTFNNFLNPSFVSNINESEMEKELERLYKATDDSSVFPQRAKKYFNVDGERKDLTGEEYVTYATAKGQTAYQMLGAITASDEYKKLDDEQKINVINSVYTYADQTAKTLVGGEVTDSTTQKALFLKDYNVPPESYVFFKTVVATQFDEDDNGSISQEELEKAIDAVSGRNPKGLSLPSDKSTTVLTNAQKAALWQTYNKGWKAKNNPYDKTIGQEIYNKLHDGSAKEEPEAEAKTQIATQTKTAKEEKSETDTADTSKSSMFKSATYDDGTLSVTIAKTKNTYTYYNVPQSVWEEFKSADSMGSYYNANIKNNDKYKQKS